MSKDKISTTASFDGLGIKPLILAVLKKIGIEKPTPIQAKAIPVAITGQDLFGVAQTGTGKTFAFGIPLIQRLAQVKGRALVLLPTRELANQVEENLKNLGRDLGLKTVSIIGGEVFNKQLYSLRRNPHVIVATPGRLLDHVKRRTIKLNDISVLVLDEADMMFDLGFAPQIEEIIKLTPTTRQTLLFSATMPAAIIKLAEKYLKSPLQIQVAPTGTTAELVDQEIYILKPEDKFKNLIKLLGEYKDLVLIFVRTRHGATALTKRLNEEGYKANEIHSNLSFNQRKTSLAGFKEGSKRILVATDVAARGLDINGIQLVLNYDLPDNSEDYVHRIGRTARAGKGGKAISFSLPGQIREIQKIERLIKKNLPTTRIGIDQKPIIRKSYSTTPERVYGRKAVTSKKKTFTTQKRFDDKKSYGDRKKFDDRKPFGGRKKLDDRKTFGNKKKFDDRKTFTDKRGFDDRKKFGDKKSFDDKKKFDDKKPYGDRKKFDDRKPYSSRKKSEDRKPFASKEKKFSAKKADNSRYKSEKFGKRNFKK